MESLSYHLLGRFSGICTYCGHDCCSEGRCTMHDMSHILVNILNRIDHCGKIRHVSNHIKSTPYEYSLEGSWCTDDGFLKVEPTESVKLDGSRKYTVYLDIRSGWIAKSHILSVISIYGRFAGHVEDTAKISFVGKPDTAIMKQLLSALKYFDTKLISDKRGDI